MKRHVWVIAAILGLLVMTGGVEFLMGRLPLGPDSRFGVWEGNDGVAMLLWVRDNLMLNVIMLIHPFEGIKAWQMAGAPAP